MVEDEMHNTTKTPFYPVLSKSGAVFTNFAGFEMPLHFTKGIIDEHVQVRTRAGLFDVSHMAEILVCGKGADEWLNTLITNDIAGLNPGGVRYTLVCNDSGGVIDDVLVYCFSNEKYMLVVNAINGENVFLWMCDHCPPPSVTVENISHHYAQLAFQGPDSSVLEALFPLPQKYYTFLLHDEIIISKTGYTGESGFELYIPSTRAIEVLDQLFCTCHLDASVWCGLGARDTLRLEAGMPLYGFEMDTQTLASELSLNRFICLTKADFIGKQALCNAVAAYQRLGLVVEGRGIARHGMEIFDHDDRLIGVVTSGTYSPSFKKSIAQVRIFTGYHRGDAVYLNIRSKKVPARLCSVNFLKYFKEKI